MRRGPTKLGGALMIYRRGPAKPGGALMIYHEEGPNEVGKSPDGFP